MKIPLCKYCMAIRYKIRPYNRKFYKVMENGRKWFPELSTRSLTPMFAVKCFLIICLFGGLGTYITKFYGLTYLKPEDVITTTVLTSNLTSNQLFTELAHEIPLELTTIPKSKRNQSTPIILFWNSYFEEQYYHFVPKDTTNIPCPYECIYTTNRRAYAAHANLRVFHERTVNPRDLPPNVTDAKNVYFTWEPPFLSFSFYEKKKFIPLDYFNYTITYRSTSETFYPYDAFVERDGTERKNEVWTEEQIDEKLLLKNSSVLIAISNCDADSKRHEYVKELSRYIKVTRVGPCDGTIICEKDDGTKARRIDTKCIKDLIDTHYFYLAFENSVCPEYVTEKFWRLKQLIVPVVLSRAIMPSNIPNDTYIAASDFESPKALAKRLKKLINKPRTYRRYFNWTKKYRKTRVSEKEINISCQLCKLTHLSPPQKMLNYKDFWNKRECVRDYALGLITNFANDINNVSHHEKGLGEIMGRTYRNRTIGKIV